MYVCICQGVTEREIHHAVRGGIITFEQLRMELGVSQCCGRCHERARHVFHCALRECFPPMPGRVVISGAAAA